MLTSALQITHPTENLYLERSTLNSQKTCELNKKQKQKKQAKDRADVGEEDSGMANEHVQSINVCQGDAHPTALGHPAPAAQEGKPRRHPVLVTRLGNW